MLRCRPWRVAVVYLCSIGITSALNSHQRKNGPALPLNSAGTLLTDESTTTTWEGPPLDDGSPTRLYSLSLDRVWHNHTAHPELAAAVDAKKAARRDWQSRRSLYFTMEDTPLFPGWGTHFAYVYAGTPPQRVSVIVDTGSHFTAFPCAECSNCGSHTDPYWDASKSSTSTVVSCKHCHGSFRCNRNKKCEFSQRYSEGSSWSAYQVEDVLWVGELTLEDKQLFQDESAYAVEFMFGCIQSQTGLFKTQLADGIMGMSADKHTLVWQLAAAEKIKERTFSLCFSLHGGTMVLGGYDPRLNKPGAEMQYTPLTKESGWFTVKVNEISLNGVPISVDASVFQRGKGTIVDSGTTDTYLPKVVATGFSKAWQAATGKPYNPCTNNAFCMELTPAELSALPTLTISMEGGVEINVRPEAYMDPLGKENLYAPRIYMEESMGAVLGANVMRDHNIVFDYDHHRVGFAEGICDYKPNSNTDGAQESGSPEVDGQVKMDGAAPEERQQEQEGEEVVDCVTAKAQTTVCDVACPVGLSAARTIVGHERWVEVVVTPAQGSGKPCPEVLAEETRECSKECPKGAPNPTVEVKTNEGGDGEVELKIEDGGEGGGQQQEQACSLEEEVWTPCSADCLQERYMGDGCEKEAEARPCHVGDLCATSKMGLVLRMSMALRLDMIEEGDEVVKEITGERRPVWMTWIGTLVSDTVASLLSEVPTGDVETSIEIVNPDAANGTGGDANGGKATLPCTAEVTIHLTPKVDNNMANRASSALNVPSLTEVLTASLLEITHASGGLWYGGRATPSKAGFVVTFVSTERASMFIASNMEPYLPPVNDRQQAVASGGARFSDRVTPQTCVVLASLLGVMVALYAVGARIKHLRAMRENSRPGFEPVSQVEMHGRGVAAAGGVGGRRVVDGLLGEGVARSSGALVEEGAANRTQRKQARVGRDGT